MSGIHRPSPINRHWWREETFEERYNTALIYGTEYDLYLVQVEHEIGLFFHEDWIQCLDCGAGHHQDDTCYRCGRGRHPG